MCQRRGITDAMPSHRVRCDRINAGVLYLPLLNMLVNYLMTLNGFVVKSAWTKNIGVYLRKWHVGFRQGLILQIYQTGVKWKWLDFYVAFGYNKRNHVPDSI